MLISLVVVVDCADLTPMTALAISANYLASGVPRASFVRGYNRLRVLAENVSILVVKEFDERAVRQAVKKNSTKKGDPFSLRFTPLTLLLDAPATNYPPLPHSSPASSTACSRACRTLRSQART
jgi:hypothetical protein